MQWRQIVGARASEAQLKKVLVEASNGAVQIRLIELTRNVRYRDCERVRTEDRPVGDTNILQPIDATQTFSKESGALDFRLNTTKPL